MRALFSVGRVRVHQSSYKNKVSIYVKNLTVVCQNGKKMWPVTCKIHLLYGTPVMVVVKNPPRTPSPSENFSTTNFVFVFNIVT